MAPLPPFDQDRWELYNVAADFSQSKDLAAKNPAKLKELQDVFAQEAIRNHVFPLDDRRVERFNPAIAGRPDLIGARTSLTLYEGMTGISENTFINIKGRSFTITAEVEAPASGANGVIIAQAGRFGGWSLYMKDGRVHHVYNFGGLQRTTVSSPQALPAGRHTVHYEFAYDGGNPGSGGMSRLSIDGTAAGEGRVPRTMPFAYSGDEGIDVGTDNETPVTEEYREGDNRFTGTIHKVTITVK
jgi:arylsulfatase